MAVPTAFSFVRKNWLFEPSVTVTPDTSQTGFGGAQVLNASLFSTLRSVAASANWQVVIDLGQNRAVQCLAALGFNGTDAATVRWELDSSSSFLSPSLDSTTVAAFDTSSPPDTKRIKAYGRHSIYVHPSEQTDRYLRLTVNDTGNPDSEYRVGVILAGQLTTPEIGWSEATLAARKRGPKASPRLQDILPLGFNDLSAQEKESIRNLVLETGFVAPVLILPRPADTKSYRELAQWARFEGEPRFTAKPRTANNWTGQLQIKEVLD